MAEETTIVTALHTLARTYGGIARNLNEDLVMDWHRILRDIPCEAVLDAVDMWLSEDHNHTPRPGNIRALARKGMPSGTAGHRFGMAVSTPDGCPDCKFSGRRTVVIVRYEPLGAARRAQRREMRTFATHCSCALGQRYSQVMSSFGALVQTAARHPDTCSDQTGHLVAVDPNAAWLNANRPDHPLPQFLQAKQGNSTRQVPTLPPLKALVAAAQVTDPQAHLRVDRYEERRDLE
mgnify:FL=1